MSLPERCHQLIATDHDDTRLPANSPQKAEAVSAVALYAEEESQTTECILSRLGIRALGEVVYFRPGQSSSQVVKSELMADEPAEAPSQLTPCLCTLVELNPPHAIISVWATDVEEESETQQSDHAIESHHTVSCEDLYPACACAAPPSVTTCLELHPLQPFDYDALTKQFLQQMACLGVTWAHVMTTELVLNVEVTKIHPSHQSACMYLHILLQYVPSYC